MPVITQAPLVLLDWLPWNHTFGGNHNFGMVLYNGGTLYIDDGKPTPALIDETLRNLREVSPTVYFNVPTGFEAIANAMKTDALLRKTLLARVQMFFYAGASLAQPVWDSLFESEEAELGQRIVMTTGMGMTESGPFGLFVTHPHIRSGDLGVPTPGLDIKLVDTDGKTELRYRGPNITPGYWRAPEETAAHFDEEGFFCTGDAVQWIDETDVHQGLKFDGRIAEDFKLATGTFVSVGPLRAKITAAGAPYIQDVVLTGINMKEVGAMVFPTPRVRELAGLDASVPLADVLASAPVITFFQGVVDKLAETATGSASRIARLCLLADPPSIDTRRGNRQRLDQPARGAQAPGETGHRICTMAPSPILKPGSGEKEHHMNIEGQAALDHRRRIRFRRGHGTRTRSPGRARSPCSTSMPRWPSKVAAEIGGLSPALCDITSSRQRRKRH
jgi:feruloyl-CoA synthase